MSVEKNNVVVIEHEFAAPVAKVFGALKEGRLFFNCGAWPEKTQVDFRKGGKYQINFAHYGKAYGEFTEIVENKHIAFTWNSDEMEVEDTRVVIDLTPSNKGCKVKLRHEGFTDQETAKGHEGGWVSGLEGCDQELIKFRVHLEREMLAPVEMLYETCVGQNLFTLMGASSKNMKVDFRVGGKYSCQLEEGEISGEFLEIERNKKIAFTWEGAKRDRPTRVKFEFGPWGDGEKNSYIELTHEGFTGEKSALAQHGVWNSTLWNLYKKVSK